MSSCEWFVHEVCDEVAALSSTFDLGLDGGVLMRRASGVPLPETDEVLAAEDARGFGPGEVLCYEILDERRFLCHLLGDELIGGRQFVIDLPQHRLRGQAHIRQVRKGQLGGAAVDVRVECSPAIIARVILGLGVD